jgi:hypothetical protein
LKGFKPFEEIRVIDIQGRLVLDPFLGVEGQKLEVKKLAPGTYWITTDKVQIQWVKF